MLNSSFAIVALTAYLLGSIPFGYILVRLFTGADVRAQGSGNIGATNVARTGKKGLAIATLLLDALKGVTAVYVARMIAMRGAGTSDATAYLLFCATVAALFAVIGHMFPVWLKFKGGKGVATGLGVFIALAPKAIVPVLLVFLIIVALTRFVSLGSILAAAFFPVSFWYFERAYATFVVLAMVCGVSLLIIWKHKDNIRRLVAGNENKLGAKKA